MAKRLDELENLLNRIWSGELNHNQNNYFSSCGTAACVCGWDFALDAHSGNLTVAAQKFDDTWNYSKDKYDLTDAEAVMFFEGSSTKLLQQTMLDKLKNGESLVCDAQIAIESDGYDSQAVTVSAISIDEYSIWSDSMCANSICANNVLDRFFDGTDVTVA